MNRSKQFQTTTKIFGLKVKFEENIQVSSSGRQKNGDFEKLKDIEDRGNNTKTHLGPSRRGVEGDEAEIRWKKIMNAKCTELIKEPIEILKTSTPKIPGKIMFKSLILITSQ